MSNEILIQTSKMSFNLFLRGLPMPDIIRNSTKPMFTNHNLTLKESMEQWRKGNDDFGISTRTHGDGSFITKNISIKSINSIIKSCFIQSELEELQDDLNNLLINRNFIDPAEILAIKTVITSEGTQYYLLYISVIPIDKKLKISMIEESGMVFVY
jgi:hypothetical protein